MRCLRPSSNMKWCSKSSARWSGAIHDGVRAGNTPPGIIHMMKRKFLVAAALLVAGAGLAAQGSAPAQKPVQQKPAEPKPQEGILTPQPPRDVIRRRVDLVTTSVVVRDDKGVFDAS